MRIIKRGNLPEQQMFKGTCYNCKTVFECQRHEGQYDGGSQRDGPFLRVKCPVCGKDAFAYPRADDAYIPVGDRDKYTWLGETSNLAGQIGNPASQFDR